MVLDALEMARRSRGARRFVGLVTHSDVWGSWATKKLLADGTCSELRWASGAQLDVGDRTDRRRVNS
jgi:hypothetical protein